MKILSFLFLLSTFRLRIIKPLSKPNRKAFLTWNREEKWKRHIDRERFREELVRKMQEMTRLHNTRLQMQRVQSSSFMAL